MKQPDDFDLKAFLRRQPELAKLMPGTVLVMYLDPEVSPFERDRYRQNLARCLHGLNVHDVLLVLLRPGESIETIDEAQMARHGWVRK